jgi:transposase-like protein
MEPTSETSALPIVKADRTGRTHYTPEYKAEVLAAFEKSGMSGQAFAAHCGIKYPTFASWRAKTRTRSDREDQSGPSFVVAEVSASPTTGKSALRVELPGGALAHIDGQEALPLLVALLKALA